MRLSSLGWPEKARQIPSQLLATVLKLIGPLFSSEDVEKDFFFLVVVAAPLVYMSWLFCMAVVKKMFLHQKRGPNVSVTLPCRSCAAARGQVMPVELAGLFSGKPTWVIYRFSRMPPAAESALMILLLGAGGSSSTMSSTPTSATFRRKRCMRPYIKYITVVGKQLACRVAGCRLAVGLPTKEINEQWWWGRRVRNGPVHRWCVPLRSGHRVGCKDDS